MPGDCADACERVRVRTIAAFRDRATGECGEVGARGDGGGSRGTHRTVIRETVAPSALLRGRNNQ